MRTRLIILLLGVVFGLGAKGVKLAYDVAAANSAGKSDKVSKPTSRAESVVPRE